MAGPTSISALMQSLLMGGTAHSLFYKPPPTSIQPGMHAAVHSPTSNLGTFLPPLVSEKASCDLKRSEDSIQQQGMANSTLSDIPKGRKRSLSLDSANSPSDTRAPHKSRKLRTSHKEAKEVVLSKTTTTTKQSIKRSKREKIQPSNIQENVVADNDTRRRNAYYIGSERIRKKMAEEFDIGVKRDFFVNIGRKVALDLFQKLNNGEIRQVNYFDPYPPSFLYFYIPTTIIKILDSLYIRSGALPLSG